MLWVVMLGGVSLQNLDDWGLHCDDISELRRALGQALTDRFAIEFLLILLRNSSWRAKSADGQIRNGFYIDFIKKFNLKRPRRPRTDLQRILY